MAKATPAPDVADDGEPTQELDIYVELAELRERMEAAETRLDELAPRSDAVKRAAAAAAAGPTFISAGAAADMAFAAEASKAEAEAGDARDEPRAEPESDAVTVADVAPLNPPK